MPLPPPEKEETAGQVRARPLIAKSRDERGTARIRTQGSFQGRTSCQLPKFEISKG